MERGILPWEEAAYQEVVATGLPGAELARDRRPEP